jgi:prophage regulatory protein
MDSKKQQKPKKDLPQFLKQQSVPTTKRYVRISQIIPSILPICKASFYNGIKAGIYPPGIKITPRQTVYDLDALLTCIEQKKSATVEHPKVAAMRQAREAARAQGATAIPV